MSITSQLKCCPKCGGPIPAEAPQGLCPRCLLQQASVPTEVGKGELAKSAPPTHEELVAAFPQLEILELIGQGGMGFVFKARQPKIERLVALKILPRSLAADPAFAERFTREGRMLARLNHPNIVAIHDFGQAGGLFYLLMEFVDGVDLRQAMKAGRFTPAQAMSVVPKICEALQFAHNEGILHRDIKPENILLDSKGRVKIADFGIAKLLGEPHTDASLTASGAVFGTPHYMAPEQLEKSGEVDQRADIFSLGVVFYEMLTGELPLGRFQPPSQKVQVDVRLDEVVLHALEKEPSRRYQQVSQVKTAVEMISGSPVAPAAPIGTPPVVGAAAAPTQRPDRFWRRFAVVVLAWIAIPFVILFVIAILGMLAAIAIPNFVKARQRALANHQQQLALLSATNPVPASAETWSPAVAPGSAPDLQKILGEAKDFMSKGAYEEALQRHIWYHNHALAIDPAQTGVRLSFALSDWMDLGRRYPKAKQALIEIRDNKTREIAAGRGYAEMVQEVQAINHELQDDDATHALFKTVREKDPRLAQQCYFYLESLLVSKGEYQWCLSHMGEPQGRFNLIRQGLDLDRDNQKRMAEMRQRTAQQMAEMNQKRGWTNSWSPPDTSEMMKKSAEDRFVGQTRQLIEILVATDHKVDAERIRDQASAVLDDPRLKSSVDDAAQKVGK
jgi:serine/threonine protein kinase